MTKKTTLLVFTILYVNLIIAQSFDFPTSEASWNYNWKDDFWNATLLGESFHMSGDTLSLIHI